MRILGTAGHVDHGKSTLVRALTGMDPDRLKEEKARAMTIDLGFAHFDLPEVGEVSIIDVPGHRDFIENMLAGVGGIDAVMLVIAADEGIMPQGREHLAILDLLGIRSGLVALTKIDMVDDPDWLTLVESEIRTALTGTALQDARLIPVSARQGRGLDVLKTELARVLNQDAPIRLDHGQPRLWVDRVFTVAGFGTVVTGTLMGGTLHIGDEVSVEPGSLRGRIRGIQANGQPRQMVGPGSRAALNLAGIERTSVARGMLVSLPDTAHPTALIDVQFRHLPGAPRPLRHHAEVKFFCGSAERIGRVRLMGMDVLAPGADGYLQIQLERPLPVANGERYILRYPSPGETIGGGVILAANPGTRWRRFNAAHLERLDRLARGLAAPDQSEVTYARQLQAAARALTTFHRDEPLRAGMAAETLRSAMRLTRPEFKAFLTRAEAESLLKSTAGGLVALRAYEPTLTPDQQAALDSMLAAFHAAPLTPPSYKDAVATLGEPLLRYALERGDLIQLAPDVLFLADTFQAVAQQATATIRAVGRIDIKGLRDQFATSRKYAQAILEFMDQMRMTRRVGDDHVLGALPIDTPKT
jgi:selenocysteine-specific elongation factor